MKFPRLNIFRKPKQPRRIIAAGVLDSSVKDFNDERPQARDVYADEIFSPGERKQARAKCRKLILDNPTAFHLAVSQMLSTVGNPGSLQVKTLDPSQAAAVEKKFRSWATATGLWTTFGKMVMALPFDGESFAVLTNVGTQALTLKMIEARRVNSPPSESTLPYTFDGIEFDPQTEEPAFYFIERKVINPAMDRGNEWDRVPALGVLHLFLDFMGEQHRGWPLLDSSARPLRAIEDLRQETIEGTRTASRITGVISSDQPDAFETSAEVSYEAMDQITMPRRGLLLLGNGLKASQMKVDPPGANLKDFHDLNVTIAGASTMTPRNIATNDSSAYNFSSARLDHILYDQWVGYLRRHLKTLLSKVFTIWLASNIDDPVIDALVAASGNILAVPHDWYFQDTVLDEETSTNVIIAKIEHNMMTYKDYYASQGKDWEVEFQQIAAEKKRMQELGIVPEDLASAPGAGPSSPAPPEPSDSLEGDGAPEPPPALIPTLKSAQDLSQKMGVPANRINGWRRLGLPSYKVGGRILYEPSAVADFIQKGSR